MMRSMKRFPSIATLFAMFAALTLSACNTDRMEQTTNARSSTDSPILAIEDISYTNSSTKPIDELIAAIEVAAAEHNFTVLQKHDIQGSLGKKGFDIPPYTIIEVCNGKFAHTILSATREAGMFLPCRIAVYSEDGLNRIIMMKPSLIRTMMPESDFGSIPDEVERILISVIEEAV